ncbi:MAG: 6-carboxytetrahydropterin synthase [Bacteroidota bacterium]
MTRRERFNAAHRLWVDQYTKEQNYELFGKCANPHFHGHNFELFVTVKGSPDPKLGWIMNVKDLGTVIKEKVVNVLDHSNLNLDPNFLPDGVQPTIETMVYYIWKELEPHIHPAQLHCVKICETENIYAEYFGE